MGNALMLVAAHSLSNPSSNHPSGVTLFDQQQWVDTHLRDTTIAPTSVNIVFKFVVQWHPFNGMAFSFADKAAARAYLSTCTLEEAAPFADAVSVYCFEELSTRAGALEDITPVFRNATAAANLAYIALHCNSSEYREKVESIWERRQVA